MGTVYPAGSGLAETVILSEAKNLASAFGLLLLTFSLKSCVLSLMSDYHPVNPC